MQLFSEDITVGSAATQLSTLLPAGTFMCAKLSVQPKDTNTSRVAVGPSGVTSAGGNAYAEIEVGDPAYKVQDQENKNSIDARGYFLFGPTSADIAHVTIEVN